MAKTINGITPGYCPHCSDDDSWELDPNGITRIYCGSCDEDWDDLYRDEPPTANPDDPEDPPEGSAA
jgi:hypothetical protein